MSGQYPTGDKGVEVLTASDAAFSGRERANVTRVWRQISRFILQSADGPMYGETKSKGAIDHQECYDSAPGQYSRDLSNAIHSTITNPAMRWSKFKYRQEELNDDKASVAWLDSVSEGIHSELNDSNFDTQVGVGYLSFTAMATMILLQEEMYNDVGEYVGMNFTNIHLGEAALQTNEKNIVDTLFRKFKLTPRQAHLMFPDEQEYADLMVKGNPDEDLEFVHCIKPRDFKDI